MSFRVIKRGGLGASDPAAKAGEFATSLVPDDVQTTVTTGIMVVDTITSGAATQLINTGAASIGAGFNAIANPLLAPLTAAGTGLLSDAIGLRQSLAGSIGGLAAGMVGAAIFGPLGGLVGQVFVTFLIDGIGSLFHEESAKERYIRHEREYEAEDAARYELFIKQFRTAIAIAEGNAFRPYTYKYYADQRNKWLHEQVAAGRIVFRMGMPPGVVKDVSGYAYHQAINGKLVEIDGFAYGKIWRKYPKPNSKVLVLASNYGASQLLHMVNQHEQILQQVAAKKVADAKLAEEYRKKEIANSTEAEKVRQLYLTEGGKLPPYPPNDKLKPYHQWVRYLIGDKYHQMKTCPNDPPLGCWIIGGYAWGQREFYPEGFEPFGFKLKPLPAPFAVVMGLKLVAPKRVTVYV